MSKATDKDKKTPKKPSDITTMAVNISVSERIEAYCKAHGMLKKDFIPRAVEFIENFNVDLTAETLYLEEKQAEKEAKEAEKTDIQALPALREQFASVMQLQHENGTLQERAANLQSDKNRLCDEIKELKEEVALLRETAQLRALKLEKVKAELKRLKKGIFNKPDSDVLKELGIE